MGDGTGTDGADVYKVWCWEGDGWSTSADKETDEEYVCGGETFFVQSLAGTSNTTAPTAAPMSTALADPVGPGCWFIIYGPCYDHHGSLRDEISYMDHWYSDTWGHQNKNSYNSEADCLARKIDHHAWCNIENDEYIDVHWNSPTNKPTPAPTEKPTKQP